MGTEAIGGAQPSTKGNAPATGKKDSKGNKPQKSPPSSKDTKTVDSSHHTDAFTTKKASEHPASHTAKNSEPVDSHQAFAMDTPNKNASPPPNPVDDFVKNARTVVHNTVNSLSSMLGLNKKSDGGGPAKNEKPGNTPAHSTNSTQAQTITNPDYIPPPPKQQTSNSSSPTAKIQPSKESEPAVNDNAAKKTNPDYIPPPVQSASTNSPSSTQQQQSVGQVQSSTDSAPLTGKHSDYIPPPPPVSSTTTTPRSNVPTDNTQSTPQQSQNAKGTQNFFLDPSKLYKDPSPSASSSGSGAATVQQAPSSTTASNGPIPPDIMGKYPNAVFITSPGTGASFDDPNHSNGGYANEPVKIKAFSDQPVVYYNNGNNEHTITDSALTSGGAAKFDSPSLRGGESYQLPPLKAGTYPFYCKIHGQAMTGTLIVQDR